MDATEEGKKLATRFATLLELGMQREDPVLREILNEILSVWSRPQVTYNDIRRAMDRASELLDETCYNTVSRLRSYVENIQVMLNSALLEADEFSELRKIIRSAEDIAARASKI